MNEIVVCDICGDALSKSAAVFFNENREFVRLCQTCSDVRKDEIRAGKRAELLSKSMVLAKRLFRPKKPLL